MTRRARWILPWAVLLGLAFSGLAPVIAACLPARGAVPVAVQTSTPAKGHSCSCPIGETGSADPASCCCHHGEPADSCRMGRLPCSGGAPVAGIAVPQRPPGHLPGRPFLARPEPALGAPAPTILAIRARPMAPPTPPPQS